MKNTVAASYQQKSDRKFYNNEVIITANDLLGCMCDCKVGARVRGKCSVVGYDDRNKKNKIDLQSDRHVCVHGPGGLYKFILEHHKGLAENILIELNVRLKTHFQEIDDLDQLKEDIQVLSCVAKRRVEIGDVGKMLERCRKNAGKMWEKWLKNV